MYGACTNLLHRSNRLSHHFAAAFAAASSSLEFKTEESAKTEGLYNEPILSYLPDSEELIKLKAAIQRIKTTTEVVPIVINGEQIVGESQRAQCMPFSYKQVAARFSYATKKQIAKAIEAAKTAQVKWDRTPISERVTIWQKAADLMSKEYRADLVAATMLGQGKTIMQAEIDAAADLIDFTRMNAEYQKQVNATQPISPDSTVSRNHFRWHALEGFVASVTPFNATAIAGNLAFAPALVGCSVVWCPSDAAILSNWIIFKIMREAGVPDGVVNFVPADVARFSEMITQSPSLAAINFIGSIRKFRTLWRLVGENINLYKNFPRLIGECGGKNFHFVHESADVRTVLACTIRSAFEYSGQKSSSCSRLYVPEKLWNHDIKLQLVHHTGKLKMGDVCDCENYLSAVIDEKSYFRLIKIIDRAKGDPSCQVLLGGKASPSRGWWVDPTIIKVEDPNNYLMSQEILGPILVVYVYKESELDKILDIISKTNTNVLTGAVFANDPDFLETALNKLRYSSGNLYINDKSTGAIVGQQIFGGPCTSATNDKAGTAMHLMRFMSPQAVKETFVTQRSIYYPYMRKF